MNINEVPAGDHKKSADQDSNAIKKSVTKPESIIVTGGTGFLGAYVIQNLVQKGYRVIAIQRKAERPFFIPSVIADKVNWVSGDIMDVDFLQDVMKNADSIIHTAAMVSFSGKDRAEMYQVNIEGTANMVNLALENNIQRFIHVSSVAALGRTTTTELIDESKKWEQTKNNTHYSITKHHSEINVWRAFAEGLNGLIINPSTILGYGNWHQSSCVVFKNAYKEFPWFTKGMNGFVGVEDVAEVAIQLLESGIANERFIVNTDNWSFQKLFSCIADNFHKKRPTREAGPIVGKIAWRAEKVKSLITGNPALLTRETAKVAQSRTQFSNGALLRALPGFAFTPLENVIEKACKMYSEALQKGILTL